MQSHRRTQIENWNDPYILQVVLYVDRQLQ
jgi:hypothetical protein